MKYTNRNKNNSKKTKNILSSIAVASMIMFGAAACSPDTVADYGGANDGYEYDPVANTEVNSFTAWDSNADNRWDANEFATGLNDSGLYDDWDMDNDNRFSENEFNEGLYDTWDRDQDGFINEEEYGLANAGWEDSFGNNFADWDMNDDSLLDTNEFGAGINDMGLYDTWDYDNDGFMDTNEFNTGLYDSWDYDNDGYLGMDDYNDLGINDWGI